ncbi:MAG TPA: beta-N-acetylhexosaminidase, partial [Chitinophagaceae bacterium]|nr:beta-N-acetylhexosaminidase [Chitinophagaceae bacterium]
MKRSLVLAVFICWGLNAFGQAAQNEKIHIIPEPVSVDIDTGYFSLNSETKILYDAASAESIAQMFQNQVKKSSGFDLDIKRRGSGRKNSISLQTNFVYDSTLGDEGYILDVTPDKIVISANDAHGLFYGVQSLKQLFPPQIESDTVWHHQKWMAKCVHIMDYAQFQWRGLMLDVSRHFFTVDEVKKYIDEMAKYKYNVFHWHLTDDQGWRMEIKGLPKLTEVGAWRIPSYFPFQQETKPKPGQDKSYGGYYTQEEVKEVIAYAKKRFVTIVPEIDVPGHSLALISAYPNLSCTQEQYPIYPGDAPDSVANVLCVANDYTWKILDTIFTQVAELFPSEYIHVGGDEANRSFWSKHAKDIALMEKEGIENPAELQSYFEKKLEKIVLSKGKKLIGWDEIVEGGLAPEAAVMSWRGMEGGIHAAEMGHHVVMAPWGKTYLSQIQGDPLIEPKGPPRSNTLKEIYTGTHIVPDGVNSDMIMGGEACLWTEYVSSFRHAQYMTWPRAFALSEVFWGNRTSWKDFVRRTEANLKYLAAAEVKYAPSMYDPVIDAEKKNGKLMVVLDTKIPHLDIYY